MLPDVIEVDELMTNERREGAFFSIFMVLEKVNALSSLTLTTSFIILILVFIVDISWPLLELLL
jgi:Na+/melibiose symporter-like transporter